MSVRRSLNGLGLGFALCGLVVACGGTSGNQFTLAADPDAGPDGGSSTADGGGGRPGDGGGGQPGDAAPGTVVADGGAGGNTGPGGTLTTLTCGTATCAIPSEVCCVYSTQNGTSQYSCVAGTTCPARGGGGGGGGGVTVTDLQCSSQANCAAGTVCCVSQSQGVAVSKCQASCSTGQAQLCDPSANPTGCPQGGQLAQCSSNNIKDWGLSPPYATCGGVGN